MVLRSFALVVSFAIAGIGAGIGGGCKQAPLAPPAPTSSRAVVAGSTAVDGSRIRPFRAEYSRTGYWGALRKDMGDAVLAVAAADGRYAVRIEMQAKGNQIVDNLALDAKTLAPVERSFGLGAQQVSLTYRGRSVDQAITDGKTTKETTVDFAAAGFDPGVLELVLAGLSLDEGEQARLAWVNLPAPTQIWARITLVRAQSIEAAGRNWSTRVYEVYFEDGSRRVFWIADEPPYKIRMENHPSGTSKYWDWRLTRVQ